MAIAAGEGAQVGDDRGHSRGELADQLEVVARLLVALLIEQHPGVVGIAADGAQRLVELVTDAGAHGAQRREFASLQQFVLGADQFLLGLLALEHLDLQPPVQRLQVPGALLNALFQLLAGAGIQRQTFDEMPPALHQQAEPEQQRQEGRGTDGDHGAHRSLDQTDGRQDAHRPVDLLEFATLDQPGIDIQRQVPRIECGVGLIEADLFAFVLLQPAGGAKAPLRLRGQDHHAEVVGHQQPFRRIAPERLGMVQVDLDHQHADGLFIVVHGGAEVVAALAGGIAEAEEASEPALSFHGLAEVRPKGEVAPDEAVRVVPVGGGQRGAFQVHQVDHIGTGLPVQLLQQAIGAVAHRRLFGAMQSGAQRGQVTEDARQYFVAAQDAQQVGDIEIERLAILFDQLVAVITLGQLLQRPEQRRQQQGQQGQVAPAGATRSYGCGHASVPVGPARLCTFAASRAPVSVGPRQARRRLASFVQTLWVAGSGCSGWQQRVWARHSCRAASQCGSRMSQSRCRREQSRRELSGRSAAVG